MVTVIASRRFLPGRSLSSHVTGMFVKRVGFVSRMTVNNRVKKNKMNEYRNHQHLQAMEEEVEAIFVAKKW